MKGYKVLVFWVVNLLSHENVCVHLDATTSKRMHVGKHAPASTFARINTFIHTHSTTINGMLNLGAFTCNVNMVLLHTDT